MLFYRKDSFIAASKDKLEEISYYLLRYFLHKLKFVNTLLVYRFSPCLKQGFRVSFTLRNSTLPRVSRKAMSLVVHLCQYSHSFRLV